MLRIPWTDHMRNREALKRNYKKIAVNSKKAAAGMHREQRRVGELNTHMA